MDDIFKISKMLIIKPNSGNMGRNIYFVQLENNNIILRSNDIIVNISGAEFMEKYHNIFLNGYIVQPYISSRTTEGNPFDVRIHVRRAKEGKWTTVKIYPRIGRPERITSNIATGGYTMGIRDFLSIEFGEDWTKIYNELLYLAKSLPDFIQSHYPYLLDALGFDVAIDRETNKLKLFEINTYPGAKEFNYKVAETNIQYYLYLYENLERLMDIQRNNI